MEQKHDLVVMSIGAGVQSSTLPYLVRDGVLPKPDIAIFADTGAEPQSVYDWLYGTLQPVIESIGVKFVVARRGNLTDDIERSVRGEGRIGSLPLFTRSPGSDKEGKLRRQCTREYKTEPMVKAIKEILGVKPGQRVKGKYSVEMWIGISTDEAIRMKPNREKWITNRWPLIELMWSRASCLQYFDKLGIPRPAKSSCVYCPHHNNEFWRDMKINDLESWGEAVRVDKIIRSGLNNTTEESFVHRQLIPLDAVDLRNLEDMGQQSMFGNECDGVCGV